ncbi:thioesterase II family protein [Micromonospora eburnea]|uniref:Surfactin synthase thioesterase subunit n=1 Tax=Micromonospora eburnea TaxID=227316 RepID=A0A1C6V0S3_9ACTN|nr:alpha/beta fold hydrolase [Micromonospora eburnea]SCL59899.1 Surfactin synthase thioesterase subunit [Micromonospora eburnea]
MSGSIRKDDSWIRRFHSCPEGATRLICLPHAGGSASWYFPMSRALSPGIDVLAVQYPGRQDRRLEPQIDNIPELVDRTYQALDGWIDAPFAFFGHSMGAVLAYELARKLRAAGNRGPMMLFVSGRRAPSCGRRSSVHRLDDERLVAELRRVGGTDERLLSEPDLRAAVLAVTRNDYRAVETYVHVAGPPLDCPISVLVGDRDPQVSVDEAAAWAEHSMGGCDLHVLPGGHFYVNDQWPRVTGIVTAAVEQVRRRTAREGSMR